MKDLYKCLACGFLEAVDEVPALCERCGSNLVQRVEGPIGALKET